MSTATATSDSGELIAFRPLCDIAADMGAGKMPATTRRAFLRDSGELMAQARELGAPRWLVRDYRERLAAAYIVAHIVASN